MRALVAAVVLLLLVDSTLAAVRVNREQRTERARKLAAFAKHKEAARKALDAKLVHEKPAEAKPAVEKLANRTANTYWYQAVDLVGSVSSNTFTCLYNAGVDLVFSRIYSGANGGSTDSTGVQNAITAYNLGLGIEVFLQPSPSSSKTGGQQFNEAYNYAVNSGLQLNRIWLLVHSPADWGSYTYSNVNFIQSVISAANNQNIQIGIYTNWYDWDQITASSTSISANTQLWYWSANGYGSRAESYQDFSDFYSFGNFRSASVKQYGVGETLCSTYLNRNIYPSNGVIAQAKNTVNAEVVAKAQKKQ
ncbi:Glycoside hydrolase, superfamily domain-containing protein [Aphelenchoides fujianensis]|nr:Glycoside hydrolase, superfamily domain-containing protein [Aphelenchoides fujianensis]